jgi:UDP-glucose 4-epimerase
LARAHVDEVNYPAPAAAISPAMSIMPAAISVLEVIDVVKQVSGVGFPVRRSGRRPGDPAAIVPPMIGFAPSSDGNRSTTI